MHLYRHVAASGTPTLLQGTVTDQRTGQPIAGAVVAISGGEIALTNTAGSYTIAAQPGVPITGVLDIRKPGYFYSNLTYDLSSGTLVTVNAALIHGGTIVQGAVTDANTGLPIGNANLFLNDSRKRGDRADGQYTVDASQISETRAGGVTIDAGAVNAAGYFDLNPRADRPDTDQSALSENPEPSNGFERGHGNRELRDEPFRIADHG